ncbi:MAG: T9SS type A sorting domain-containing protein [Saprospiraceae bacterium]|nr:T9SS type A sorting domain-containing protein [Saprospiraceae bacterium]
MMKKLIVFVLLFLFVSIQNNIILAQTGCQNQVLLNTGYNHSTNALYATGGPLFFMGPIQIGDYDPYWKVIQMPNLSTCTNIVSGGPSAAIIPDPTWALPYPLSRWLSFRFDYQLTCNNSCPELPIIFERQFCMLKGDIVTINIQCRFDNAACLFLDGVPLPLTNVTVPGGTPVTFLPNQNILCDFCNNWDEQKTFQAGYETRVNNYVINLPANNATHSLQVRLRNNSSQSCGFNLIGNITGTIANNFLCADSCQKRGTIAIQKVLDRNCNGVLDAGEAGAGWTFNISGPGYNSNVITDSYGTAYVSGINYGSYTITEINQAGWIPSSPINGTITIPINSNQVQSVVFYNCPKASCCDSLTFPRTAACCSALSSVCKIKSLHVSLNNAVFSEASWDCGNVPPGFYGTNSYTFTTLAPCFTNSFSCCYIQKDLNSPVTITYDITFADGSSCRQIRGGPSCPPTPCCATIDKAFFVPFGQIKRDGYITINNLDPSSPICNVLIYYNPTTTFFGSQTFVDGTPCSTCPFLWTSTNSPFSLPANGSIAATNSIKFKMSTNFAYTGNITIKVIKCDSSSCTSTFLWPAHKNPFGQFLFNNDSIALETGYGLSAYQISLKALEDGSPDIKYVSIGFSDSAQIATENPEFFAISGSVHPSDPLPDYLAKSEKAKMGKRIAFFELEEVLKLKKDEISEKFNIVLKLLKGKTTKLQFTLFNTEGEIIHTDAYEVLQNTNVITTSLIDIKQDHDEELFELIEAYPNPAQNQINIKYGIGRSRNIIMELYNQEGKLIKVVEKGRRQAGIHTLKMDLSSLLSGVYILKLNSENKISALKFVVTK